MTTEEKLGHFYEHAVNAAQKEAEQRIQQHREALDRLFEEHKEVKKRQAIAELEDEKEQLKRDQNKVLSGRQLLIKRQHSSRLQEMQNQIFREVTEKLNAFRATPEYVDYLCAKIREAATYVNSGEEIEYYMDASDSELIPAVEAKTGVTIQTSYEPIVGGLRAGIAARNLLIDFSFASALEDEQEAFQLNGGN